jgi:hypothetical protein
MGRLNEFIARASNKEDDVKGRFWESRFKCQALLDDAAIAACMVYVDLNPIRSGLAATPEDSDFTSIQLRIRAWQLEMTESTAVFSQDIHTRPSDPFNRHTPISENISAISSQIPAMNELLDYKTLWLCPIASESGRRGILPISSVEYFDLVDNSGRTIRSNKRGSIDATLAPILMRIHANPEAWPDTVSRFGAKFHLVAGLLSNLRHFARLLGRRWLKGVTAAQSAFAPSP